MQYSGQQSFLCHWKLRFVMTSLSVMAPAIAIMTIFVATSDEKAVIMMIHGSSKTSLCLVLSHG